jgi:hypothetical protein
VRTGLPLQLEALEDRIVPAENLFPSLFAVNPQLQIQRLDPSGATPGIAHTVVFLESSVADLQVLCQGLEAGTEAVVLDSGGDGVREMAAFLAGQHDLAAIHVVAHGAPGAVALGTATLDEHSLGSYPTELAALGSALGSGGELDLWSCDVAAGEQGAALMRELAATTGKTVSASDHVIGSAALGGEWQLDVTTGLAKAAVPFSADAVGAFHDLLGAWTAAGSMTTARETPTATLLSSG